MVRVKICGITNAADALAAIDAGANLLGFNFYAVSPRHISEAEAAKIRRQLPKKVDAVGIFVNAPPADVAALCKSLKLNAAQLHGDETAETVAEVAGSVPVVKAFRVDPDFDLKTLNNGLGCRAASRSQAPYHFSRRPEGRKRSCRGAHRAALRN